MAIELLLNQVSEPAVITRVNRHLAHKGQSLRKWRGEPRYYLLDVRRNRTLAERVNLETFARELGVLSVGENMEPATT